MSRLPRLSRFRRPAVHFTYLLRRAEQYAQADGPVSKLLSRYYRSTSRHYGMRYGIAIPPGICGPGLFIVHPGGIVISGNACIGKDLRIHAGVNIGQDARGTPSLGDGVYLGPGAKLFGDIHIADNVQVGANAVVNQSIPANCVVIGPYASVLKNNTELSLNESACKQDQDNHEASSSYAEPALSPEENRAVIDILERELGSSDELNLPIRDISVDSFTLVTLRTIIEMELVKIPDSQWSSIGRLSDIARLPAVVGVERKVIDIEPPGNTGSTDTPCQSIPMMVVDHKSLSAVYTVGMPQMALSGLGESWLLKEFGDVHWKMITSFLQAESSAIMDESGDRLYATFARMRIEADPSLRSVRENETLSLNSELSRFGPNIYFSHHNLVCEGTRIAGRAMSSFAKHGEAGKNTSLIKGSPVLTRPDILYSEPELPEFGVEYQEYRANHIEDCIFECDYDILAPHDINGVGLIYFAAYPFIFDICLSRFEGAEFLISHSVSMRDVFYFANAEPSERLKFVLHSRQVVGDSVHHSASIYRSSDDSRMAYIRVTRVSI